MSWALRGRDLNPISVISLTACDDAACWSKTLIPFTLPPFRSCSSVRCSPPLIDLVQGSYGRITTIDLNKGEKVWQIAHGETADNVKNHAALKGIDIPRTGRLGRVGVLVTKTLTIAGDSGIATQPNGQRGAMLRAYEKATGSELDAVFMPAPQSGSPMTYLHNGKQYLVIAISGGNYSGELVAFKLPG